jgi:hypothetical protein
MINSRTMRMRHLRELDRENGWEEATWGTATYVDEGIILKWSLKLLVEKGWAQNRVWRRL